MSPCEWRTVICKGGDSNGDLFLPSLSDRRRRQLVLKRRPTRSWRMTLVRTGDEPATRRDAGQGGVEDVVDVW